MGEFSKISWTTHTFNPWIGCKKISPACRHCYAEEWAKRFRLVSWGGARRRTAAAYWRQPHKWNAKASSRGTRPRVFCASLADVFDNEVPQVWREDLFDLIRQTPNLDWLLLTKRIGNARAMLPCDWGVGYRNVWLGSTVATQQELLRDVPKLLAIPAVIHFLSCEPLLQQLDLGALLAGTRGLHWVICGGESGRQARPLALRWAERLRAQCKEREIAFYMKQGSEANWPHFQSFERFPASVQAREFPRAA